MTHETLTTSEKGQEDAIIQDAVSIIEKVSGKKIETEETTIAGLSELMEKKFDNEEAVKLSNLFNKARDQGHLIAEQIKNDEIQLEDKEMDKLETAGLKVTQKPVEEWQPKDFTLHLIALHLVVNRGVKKEQ